MFPTFTTARFLLREIEQRDIDAVFRGLSNPDVIRYYGVSYRSLDETQTQMDWYRDLQEQQSGLWWGIAFREAPEQLIGACGFNDWSPSHRRIELGYWLMPEHWRCGVMSECLPPILRHAFDDMRIHRIEAVVDTDNLASRCLLERIGFRHEGTRRDGELKDERFIDTEHYGLLSSDPWS